MPNSRGRIAWAVSFALAWLILSALFIPSEPFFPPSEPDASWMMTLQWARLDGADFGKGIVFTYGPWGFICNGYDPKTYGWAIAGWTLFAAAFFAGVAVIAQRMTKRWWLEAVWLVVVVLMSGLQLPLAPDFRLYSLCAMILALHFLVSPRALRGVKILLVVAMALASLCKFSIAIAATGTIVVIGLDQIARRRLPWAILVYIVAVVGFWLAAGQTLKTLPNYIAHSLQIVSGYGQSQSAGGAHEWIHVAWFLLCGALLLFCVAFFKAMHRRKRGLIHVLLAIVGLIFLLFMDFKAGYVRYDPAHEPVGTISLTILSLLCGGAVWRTARGRLFLCSIGGGVVVASLALTWASLSNWTEMGLPGHWLDSIETIPTRAALAFRSIGPAPSNTLAKHDQDYLRDWRDRRPLPAELASAGRVDVYPYGQAAVLAWGLKFNPRPVFQSYVASTVALAELNRDFVRSDKSPDIILFDVAAVDGHYPSLDDGLSWPDLLTRYDLADASHLLLVLKRADEPGHYSLNPLKHAQAHFNQWMELPETPDAVWAAIDVRAMLRGKLLQTLYKAPILWIDVRTRKGQESRFRLVPELGRAGFVLSPIIPDAPSFALLESSSWREYLDDAMVSAIRILADTPSGSSAAYDPAINCEFSSLQFPGKDISAIPGIQDQLVYRQFIRQMRIVQAQAPFLYGMEDGRPVLVAPGTSEILLPVPANATALQLGFGLGRQSAPYGRAQFRVFSSDAATGRRGSLLWSAGIAPPSATHQSVEIRLPAAGASAVLLQIIPAPDTFDPYWTDVHFK